MEEFCYIGVNSGQPYSGYGLFFWDLQCFQLCRSFSIFPALCGLVYKKIFKFENNLLNCSQRKKKKSTMISNSKIISFLMFQYNCTHTHTHTRGDIYYDGVCGVLTSGGCTKEGLNLLGRERDRKEKVRLKDGLRVVGIRGKKGQGEGREVRGVCLCKN